MSGVACVVAGFEYIHQSNSCSIRNPTSHCRERCLTNPAHLLDTVIRQVGFTQAPAKRAGARVRGKGGRRGETMQSDWL